MCFSVQSQIQRRISEEILFKKRKRKKNKPLNQMFYLIISFKVTAGPTIIPVGGGVTLSCSVDDSDGWKYDWFRRTSNSNEAQVVGEENRDIRVSQGGIYRCRGRRGKPVYYTVYSDEVTLIQYFYLCLSVSISVSVTLQPDWSQIFRGEKITVRCEIQGGGDTEWDYEWKTPQSTSHQTHVNYWTLSVSESSSGNYMCRGRNRRDSYSSTQWSKTITLTVSEKPKPQLSADYRVIPVGGSVTLSCSVNPSSGWKYYWYRGDQSSELLIRHDDVFKSNGQISVSQEGQYWCRGGRGEPVYYSQYSQLFPNCQTDSTDMSCYLVVTVALKRILTWFMDRHTQQDMCVELEEENQCFTLNTANQRLSGLEVSLFLCSFLFIFIFQLFVCDQHVKSMSAK
uniref:Ig-like domain-containing protein n=1 Tax=Anabas testudineus TaxID=64144 RepID=A0A3Q1ICD6_ANATE